MKKVGRPLKIKTVAKMQRLIDKYFTDCDEHMKKHIYFTEEGEQKEELIHDPIPYTVTGLALSLDMSRQNLLDYEKKEKFYEVVRRAKDRCQEYAEKQLYNMNGVKGAQFSLKNNWGWLDKTEQDVNLATEIKVIPPDFNKKPDDEK